MRSFLLKFVNLGNKGGLRGLGADSVFYGGGRALQAMAGLLTLPLVTRILTQEELGQATIILMFPVLLLPLAILGQDMALVKFLPGNTKDTDERDINATALAIQFLGILISVAVASAIGVVFSDRIEVLLGEGLFWVVLISIPIGVLFAIVLILSKSRFLRGIFLGVSVLQVFLYTTFLVGTVIVLRYGVYGYVLSSTAALMLASIVGLYLMRDRFLGGKVSWGLTLPMLRYGAPYVVAGLLVMLLIYLDRLVLGWRVSSGEIATYTVAFRYSGLIEMALMGFKMAWWPFAFSSYSASGDTGLFGRTLTAYVVVVGGLVAGLYSLSEIGIDLLAGAGYAEALVFVLPLLLAQFLRGFQLPLGVGIAISGRSFWAPVGTFAGIVVGLVATLILWPSIGILAAAWGVVCGELTALVATTMISQKFLPLRWQFKRALFLAGILLLYLGLSEARILPTGPIPISAFLLIYGTIGWYVLRSPRFTKSNTDEVASRTVG